MSCVYCDPKSRTRTTLLSRDGTDAVEVEAPLPAAAVVASAIARVSRTKIARRVFFVTLKWVSERAENTSRTMRAIEYLIGSKGKSGFGSKSTAEEVTFGLDLKETVAIVTGSSSGLGLETARILAKRGSHVIMAVRNTESGNKGRDSIVNEIPSSQVTVMELDLSSFQSVRKFSESFKETGLPLNILINNAGVMWCPFELSKSGYEMHFATNHLGHFLLTNELLPILKETATSSGRESRIVNVASIAHMHAPAVGIQFESINSKDLYNSLLAYGQSKIANILHAIELAKRLQAENVQNVTINALCPGGIRTKLQRYSTIFEVLYWPFSPFFKSIAQGAATQCYVATNPGLNGVTGRYFYDCNEGKALRKEATDMDLAAKLWEFSETAVAQN